MLFTVASFHVSYKLSRRKPNTRFQGHWSSVDKHFCSLNRFGKCDKTTLKATPSLVMVFCGVGQGSLLFCQAGRPRPPSILNLIPPSLCLWEMMSLALTLIYVSVWKLLCCKVYASLGSQLVVHARSDSVAVCWSPIIDLREGGH